MPIEAGEQRVELAEQTIVIGGPRCTGLLVTHILPAQLIGTLEQPIEFLQEGLEGRGKLRFVRDIDCGQPIGKRRALGLRERPSFAEVGIEDGRWFRVASVTRSDQRQCCATCRRECLGHADEASVKADHRGTLSGALERVDILQIRENLRRDGEGQDEQQTQGEGGAGLHAERLPDFLAQRMQWWHANPFDALNGAATRCWLAGSVVAGDGLGRHMDSMELSADLDLFVNGEAVRMPAGLNVAGLLTRLGFDGRKVAVERNAEIVRRSSYAATPLAAADRIEIVHFIGGG